MTWQVKLLLRQRALFDYAGHGFLATVGRKPDRTRPAL